MAFKVWVMGLDRPVMLYDGECGFCRRWVGYLAKVTGERVRYEPYQEVLDSFKQVSKKACMEAVQLVDTDGCVYSAAEAVLRVLVYSKRWGWLYGWYRRSRIFAWAAEGVYRWVAGNRWRWE